MATRGVKQSVNGGRGGRSWAQVVAGGTERAAVTADAWPALGVHGATDLDVDSQLLMQMEARQDREGGADAYNGETFGDDAGTWSFEAQLAANRVLWERAQPPPEPQVEPAPQPQPQAQEQPQAPPPPPPPPPAQGVDPEWLKLGLTAEQQQCMEMSVWVASGLLWGRCKCCKVWVMGPEHFETDKHMRKCGGTAGPTQPAATTRSPEVKVFYPTGFAGSTVDGALLVD